MSGETEAQESGWTVDQLSSHDRDMRALAARYETRIETLKDRLDEERDRRYREVDRERRKALDLQASEYERRLAALNHAHEQAVAVQHTYVTQEVYDREDEARSEALALALVRVNDKLAMLEKKADTQQGAVEEAARAVSATNRRNALYIAVATLLLGFIVLFANNVPLG